jgi:hypothetical protein
MMRLEDVSEENLDDLFEICSGHRGFAPRDDPIIGKSVEIKRRLLLDILDSHGPCAKIAYIDGKPVAQILFIPEETMPYVHDPREDVVFLQCIYSPFPDTQRKGAAAALMKDLINECETGLSCLGGKPCSFLVTRPFAHEGDLSLSEFYGKYGFRHGSQEMFLEVKRDYGPREASDYQPLPEDLGKTVILYNPLCEWGHFAAHRIKELLQESDQGFIVKTFNVWERPEEYLKRPLPRVTSARVIVDTQVNNISFWTNREAFIRNVKGVLGK